MGIFRKAGVKSRIAKLRTLVESAGAANAAFANENMSTIDTDQSSLSFDGSQAHDVADLVKQYFRELPDALLTNKLSETFIAIFQRKYYSLFSKTVLLINYITKYLLIFVIFQMFRSPCDRMLFSVHCCFYQRNTWKLCTRCWSSYLTCVLFFNNIFCFMITPLRYLVS